MNETLLEVLFVLARTVAVVLVAVLLAHVLRKKPCWLFNCEKKHLAIAYDSLWNTSGECHRFGSQYTDSYRHPIHRDAGGIIPCTVTRWVCPKCGKMGYFCVGETRQGAWKIEYGKLVPDEKVWSQWPVAPAQKKETS